MLAVRVRQTEPVVVVVDIIYQVVLVVVVARVEEAVLDFVIQMF